MKAKVVWEFDVDDDEAISPRAVATKALEAQRRAGSIATVFRVVNIETGEAWLVDLDPVTETAIETKLPRLCVECCAAPVIEGRDHCANCG